MNDASKQNFVGTIEDDSIAQQLPTRATFIPLRHRDLRAKLSAEFRLSDQEQAAFDHLCDRLQAIFHVEHLTELLELEDLYATLDPDREFVDLTPPTPEQQSKFSTELIDRLANLLRTAHYKQLTRQELETAIEIGCQWGVQLNVDFEIFERLEIFARGFRTVVYHRRRWQNFFLEESIELPEFQRLILMFRVKPNPQPSPKTKQRDDATLDDQFVYIKTFKNIPETDLEILLPGSSVRLTKLDRAKILLPTLSGMAITIYKIARGVLVLSLAVAINNIIAWIALIGASLGYVVKSVLSYFRTKNQYQFGLTKNLYLKNLDNNSSAIFRMLNEAEEQELCETILAYTFLWKHPDASTTGTGETQLDQWVESFLMKATEIDIDFEADDALAKLQRLGLATCSHDQKWSPTNINDATESLNRNWNEMFEAKFHHR